MSPSSLYLVGVLVVCIGVAQFCDAKLGDVKKATKSDDRGRLISTLFDNYDKRNYPSGNQVNFGLVLIKFDADETKKIFTADAWIQMVWSDPRLEWEPTDFGGEDTLSLPTDEVWKPDISLYNTADQLNLLPCTKSNVLVKSNGAVLWVPTCHFEASCDVKPFAEGPQNCTLKFGPWTVDANIVDIQLSEPKADVTTAFMDMGDLALTENIAFRNSTKYPCCPNEEYVSVTYDFTFVKKN